MTDKLDSTKNTRKCECCGSETAITMIGRKCIEKFHVKLRDPCPICGKAPIARDIPLAGEMCDACWQKARKDRAWLAKLRMSGARKRVDKWISMGGWFDRDETGKVWWYNEAPVEGELRSCAMQLTKVRSELGQLADEGVVPLDKRRPGKSWQNPAVPDSRSKKAMRPAPQPDKHEPGKLTVTPAELQAIIASAVQQALENMTKPKG